MAREEIVDLVDVIELGFVRTCETMKEYVIAEDERNDEDLGNDECIQKWMTERGF